MCRTRCSCSRSRAGCTRRRRAETSSYCSRCYHDENRAPASVQPPSCPVCCNAIATIKELNLTTSGYSDSLVTFGMMAWISCVECHRSTYRAKNGKRFTERKEAAPVVGWPLNFLRRDAPSRGSFRFRAVVRPPVFVVALRAPLFSFSNPICDNRCRTRWSSSRTRAGRTRRRRAKTSP